MSKPDYESEFLLIESELVFLAHAVEQSLENMHGFAGSEEDASVISYGCRKSFERLIERFREVTRQAIPELL